MVFIKVGNGKINKRGFLLKRVCRSERGLFLASVGFGMFEFSRPYPGEGGGLHVSTREHGIFSWFQQLGKDWHPWAFPLDPPLADAETKSNGVDSQDHWKRDDTVIPRA